MDNLEENDGGTPVCYYCLRPLVWDDAQYRLWCPHCRSMTPNG